MTLSTTHLSILGAEGEQLHSFGFFDDNADTVVDELSTAIGSPAAITSEANPHGDFTRFDWSGLQLLVEERATEFPIQPTFFVIVTAATVGPVSIATESGLQVGSAEAAVAALAYRHNLDDSMGVHFYLTDEVPVDEVDFADYEPAALSTWAWVDPPTGLVERIDAPRRNWGA